MIKDLSNNVLCSLCVCYFSSLNVCVCMSHSCIPLLLLLLLSLPLIFLPLFVAWTLMKEKNQPKSFLSKKKYFNRRSVSFYFALSLCVCLFMAGMYCVHNFGVNSYRVVCMWGERGGEREQPDSSSNNNIKETSRR